MLLHSTKDKMELLTFIGLKFYRFSSPFIETERTKSMVNILFRFKDRNEPFLYITRLIFLYVSDNILKNGRATDL
jgi:hypothetical protein